MVSLVVNRVNMRFYIVFINKKEQKLARISELQKIISSSYISTFFQIFYSIIQNALLLSEQEINVIKHKMGPLTNSINS